MKGSSKEKTVQEKEKHGKTSRRKQMTNERKKANAYEKEIMNEKTMKARS